MSYPPPGPPQPQPYGYPGYPAGPSSVSAGPTRLRGRTPRLLGWIFLALAVVLFVVGGIVLATKSLGKVSGFQRVTIASGGGTVNLTGTGKWVVYYEASDVSDSISNLPPIRVAVLDPSGAPVPASYYGNPGSGAKIERLTYEYNGHNGVAAFQFSAATPGAYRLEVAALGGLPSDADLAVGRDIKGGTIAGGILIVVGVLSLIAAVVLLIVGFVKRGRHKRELQAAAYYGAPPPYGPPTGPPPYGPPYGAPPPYGPPPSSPPGAWGPPNGPPTV